MPATRLPCGRRPVTGWGSDVANGGSARISFSCKRMILITGGAGFIGSNLAAALAARAEPVAVCDRLRAAGKWHNLARVPAARAHRSAGAARVAVGQASRSRRSSTWGRSPRPPRRMSIWSSRSISACRRRCGAGARARASASFTPPPPRPTVPAEHGFDDDGTPEALARLRPLNPYGWSKHLFDRWVAHTLAGGRSAPAAMGGAEVLQRLWTERVSQGRHAQRHRTEVSARRRGQPGDAVPLVSRRRARRRRRSAISSTFAIASK